MGQEARRLQVDTLNDWFQARYGGCGKPVFLCWDLNSEPDSEILARLQDKWLLLSGTGPTYSTEHPDRCIDFILSFKDAIPIRTAFPRVLTDGTAELSDHFPVLVTVEY